MAINACSAIAFLNLLALHEKVMSVSVIKIIKSDYRKVNFFKFWLPSWFFSCMTTKHYSNFRKQVNPKFFIVLSLKSTSETNAKLQFEQQILTFERFQL